MMRAQYVEIRIEGRVCYVAEDDLRIFYGLAGHVTGQKKSFNELPDDGCIIQITRTYKRPCNRRYLVAAM